MVGWLDNQSWKLLKHLYKSERLTFEEVSKITGKDGTGEKDTENRKSDYIKKLLQHNFVEIWADLDKANLPKSFCGYRITLDGVAYVEQRRREGRNFWVPYLITTAIAALSLLAALLDHL